MSRFYLTLPSNSSMEYYPQNTVAQYTTKLTNLIELEGDWEVGLTEISVPSNVENIISDRCYYDIHFRDFFRRISLKAGHYRMLEELLYMLHFEQRTETQLPGTIVNVEFSYVSKRIQFEIETQYVVGIEFSEDLARLLGFDDNVRYMGLWHLAALTWLEILIHSSFTAIYWNPSL